MYMYRVRYLRQVNDEYVEWVTTGLMTKSGAEKVAANLRKSHMLAEVYIDVCEY